MQYSAKDHIRRQKEKEREQKKVQDGKQELDNIKKMCNEFKLLINDKRYSTQKYILDTMLEAKTIQRNNLRYTVKTTDEYIKLGLVLDGEIGILKDILNMPQTFFEKLRQETNIEGKE